MTLLREYIDGDYEITQYSSGGNVRDRLSREILADYTNYWTTDGSVHAMTQRQIDHIQEKLGVSLTTNKQN